MVIWCDETNWENGSVRVYRRTDEQIKSHTLRAGCNQKHFPTEKLHYHIRDDYLRHHPSENLSHNQSRTGVRIDQLTGPRAVVILIKSGTEIEVTAPYSSQVTPKNSSSVRSRECSEVQTSEWAQRG